MPALSPCLPVDHRPISARSSNPGLQARCGSAIGDACRAALLSLAVVAAAAAHAGNVMPSDTSAVSGAVAAAGNPATPDAVTPDGGQYFGPLVHGLREGQGRVVWPDGTRYEGGFQAGEFAGQGQLQSDDFSYIGQFEHGRISGLGVMLLPDGRRLSGTFVRGHLQGHGRIDDGAGARYEGSFDALGLQGPGSFRAKDGTHYEGNFKDSQYDGQGELTLDNGDHYSGSFQQGLYHGAGALHYAKPHADGRTVLEGTWRYGEPFDALAERAARDALEQALYRQSELLERSIAGLAPHEPGRINLYLLAVAGYGDQDVFRNEVDFVREQFDRDFGTRDRSLVLINNPATLQQHPMATRISIRRALQAIAARMDTAQDILFLFVTSHGARDHVISLQQKGLGFLGLSAGDLAQDLRATGIRWKVIVVSACYSGGFIDPLVDDHTLIITAARADRTSFGCADDAEYTDFGRAYFVEALPHSASFAEAFHRAEAQIVARETAIAGTDQSEGKRSFPQMREALPIRAHLDAWRRQLPDGPALAPAVADRGASQQP